MSTDLKTNADERHSAAEGKFQGLHSQITERVIGVFFDVYNELGSGFLESVYPRALKIALTRVDFMLRLRCRFQCIFAVRLWEIFVPT